MYFHILSLINTNVGVIILAIINANKSPFTPNLKYTINITFKHKVRELDIKAAKEYILICDTPLENACEIELYIDAIR